MSVGTGSTVSDQRDGLLLPDGGRDWLGEFCRQYYYLPALAFWRALEARTLGNRPLTSPSLDVGGYDGTFAATWLGDRPPIDVGLDLEPRRTPDTDRAYRRLVAGNAQALEFADGEFATVVCNSVLEHVSDDVKALGELARVLRSGGELLLSTPSVYLHPYLAGVQRALKTGDKAAAIAYAEETDRRLMHLRYRPFEEWKRLLQERGMDLVEASYYLPRRASTLWDALDHAFTRTVAGRPLYEHLVAGRLWSLDVRRPLAAAGRILLQRPYDVAVRQQDGLRVPGGSLFMRARKLAA